MAHIEELVREGIPAPRHVPWIFVANPETLQIGQTIWAYDDKSSGEIEYVLLIDQDQTYVCLGSDHTDRGLEALTIERSKQIYPRVLSKNAWKLEELLPQWDRLRISSRVLENGRMVDYQSGTLAQLIRPEQLLDLIGPDPEPGTALFSGTLPVLSGGIRSAARFEGTLTSDRDTTLATLGYDVLSLPEQAQPS